MLMEVFTFGGAGFFLLVAVFVLFELSCLFNASGKGALVTFGVFAAVLYAFVGGTPKVAMGYVLVYLACGLLWVPIYWYLRLRENRRQIMQGLAQGDTLVTSLAEVHRSYQAVAVYKDRVLLPRHPAMDDLIANGVVWFLAAPVYLANDWIRVGIGAITGMMTKIQKSMAVSLDEPPKL